MAVPVRAGTRPACAGHWLDSVAGSPTGRPSVNHA